MVGEDGGEGTMERDGEELSTGETEVEGAVVMDGAGT